MEQEHTNSSYIPPSKPAADILSNPSNSLFVATEIFGGSGRKARKNCFTGIGPMKDILISSSISLYSSRARSSPVAENLPALFKVRLAGELGSDNMIGE